MISIITPCKNIISEGREAFFIRMMETLAVQTYRQFEHIVMDGGSADGSLELLKRYQQQGLIHILKSQKDANLHEALNNGLRLARGEYIHVMNSDNYFSTSEFFARSLQTIEDTGADFTHADRVIVPRNGGQETIRRGEELVAFFRMPFRYQTMLIRKSVYDELGPLDERYQIASDYKFMMHMLLNGKKGCYIPRVFIHSLDGGITADRTKVVDEVSSVLFEVYGSRYGLSREECRCIYLQQISVEFFEKIERQVTHPAIRKSLEYCYRNHHGSSRL